MSNTSVSTTDHQQPVVVIGAGPVGLAAAAHLLERGAEPLVLEAGQSAATAVREWAHVRLFSPWAEVTDPAAEKLLAPTGWTRPDGTTYPTG
ncbi:FAD-dependent oxidoreductase, partial [Streptomyces rochei]